MNLAGLSRSTRRYHSTRPPEAELRAKLRELAHQRPGFGYRRPGILLRRDGVRINHRKLLRLYRSEGLVLFIQPGKPTQNAFVESFNGSFQDECLNTHWFTTLDDARREIETWRVDYNDVRPHSSLKDRTPTEFAAAYQETAA
jgi:Integrase core domain/HTH-like domain